jgi:hypothetical protein
MAAAQQPTSSNGLTPYPPADFNTNLSTEDFVQHCKPAMIVNQKIGCSLEFQNVRLRPGLLSQSGRASVTNSTSSSTPSCMDRADLNFESLDSTIA